MEWSPATLNRTHYRIPSDAKLFDLPPQSPEQILLLATIARAVDDITSWIEWRITVNRAPKKSHSEKLGALWADAVVAYWWLHGMTSARITFHDTCEFLGWDEDDARQNIMRQFSSERLSSLNGPEAVDWMQAEYIPAAWTKGERRPIDSKRASHKITFARAALARQAQAAWKRLEAEC